MSSTSAGDEGYISGGPVPAHRMTASRSSPSPLAKFTIIRATERTREPILQARGLFDRPPLSGPTHRYLSDRRNVLYLALSGGRAIGFLRGTALSQLDNPHPQMFLYEIAVTAPFRRRRVGRALVQRLLQDCRSHHFDEVFVFTSPHNRAAVRLYRSTGARTETRADRMFVYRLAARRMVQPTKSKRARPRH